MHTSPEVDEVDERTTLSDANVQAAGRRAYVALGGMRPTPRRTATSRHEPIPHSDKRNKAENTTRFQHPFQHTQTDKQIA
jgi:hypothetical protein